MAQVHGKNGLIYVSGAELTGANAWTLDMGLDIVEVGKFGDTWKEHVGGLLTWSGTISAWEMGDEQELVSAATAGVAVALLIYPDNSDLTSYYSGNAVFGASTDGSTGSAVSKNGTFTGNSQLTITGFT